MWRKRMQDLSRSAGKPHTPLFAPMLFGIAAQIESISPQAMASDPTKLRKNLGELRRILGLDAVYCLAPGEAEAKALGPVGSEVGLESIVRQANIAASLEAVHQWCADASEPVIIAAMHGPATLLKSLRVEGCEAADAAALRHVGRGLAAIVRAFAEAGVHVVQFHDDAPPAGAVEAWTGALGTAGNVARFHRVPLLLVLASAAVDPPPLQAIPCPTRDQHPPTSRPHGRAWPAMPDQWSRLPGDTATERIVTTVAEVHGDTTIASLFAGVRRTLEQP